MPNLNGASVAATPPPNFSFDVDGARKAGYSDTEIASHLADTKSGFDVNGALKAGYSPTEVLDHLSPQPSSSVDNLRQGTSEFLSGVGSTIKNYVGDGYGGDTLENAGKSIAPANFVPSPLVDKDGFHPSNVVRALARATPGAAAAIGAGTLAALAAPEAAVMAPIAGATAAGVAMTAGPEAQQAAANRTGDPNATPNTADLTRGGLTSLGSSAVQALPVGRYLSTASTLAKTGGAGALAALKKLGVTSAAQGAASAGSNVAEQTGQSVGTPGGITVDPTQVADSAAGGVLTGAVFGARPAAREALDSAKYRAITPDLQPAATQFANRMQQAADGANLKAGVIGGGAALRTGADVFNKASAAVHNELGDAVDDLQSRVTLPTDANNVLRAAMKGQTPTASDYATLSQAVAGDPQANNVMNLVRQAHVANIVEDSGTLTGKKFVGGLSALPTALNAHTAEKTALAATMAGAAIEGGAGHLISYSPEAVLALAGVAGAARIADKLTGARSPAGRFVSNFADGTTPVRQAVPVPQVPAGPSVTPSGPTGPKIPPLATPWGAPPPATPAQLLTPAAKQQMIAQAMVPLRALAAAQGPNAPVAPSVPPVADGSIIPPQVRVVMNARANLAKLGAANAPAPTAPSGAAAEAPAAINPLALPKSITGPAANIVRGAALAQKLSEAQQQPVASSPPTVMDPLALPKNVTGPAASTMRGATLAQKLKDANGAQGTQAPVQQSAPVSVSKVDGGSLSVNTGASQYRLPLAPYWNLPVPEAANRIMRDQLAANVPIKNSGAFLAKTIGVLNTLRDKVQAVTQAAPTIPAVEVARFEGIKTQKAAAEYRDHLKSEHPQAAAALDRVFSNEAIANQWAQKR